MPVRRFYVVLPSDRGDMEVHPMKQWLRQHPELIPENMHPDHYTSHQIREGLRRAGWLVDERADEVRLVSPVTVGAATESAPKVVGQSNAPEEEGAELEQTAFHLEAQLRDFIADNLGAIDFGGPQLRLYADENGQGIEYRTAAGSIDILATDAAGALYVFELKRAKSPDQAIGQLARYMGALRHKFGNDRIINGVIVAREITQNLRYAIAAVPNVRLFEYEVRFALNRAEHLPHGR